MKKLLTPLLFLPLALTAQHEVFLLGNFNETADHAAFRQQLGGLFEKTASPFTLILNGDFTRNEGGPAGSLENVFALADLVEKHPNGHLLLVPGEAEWNYGRPGGEKNLEDVEKAVRDYFDEKKYTRCTWATDRGCPGPEVYEVGDAFAIVALNTQWWNHPHDKPRPTDARCDGLSEENLKEGLAEAVEEYNDRNVLIVGHHPVRSLGNYGGYFSALDHFVPVPLLAEMGLAFHAHAGNQFDLANERLQVFAEQMKNLLYFHDNLILAAGHEKNQQILAHGGNYLVNSGAPSRPRYAARDQTTVFSERMPGIMGLRYAADGRVDAVFYENNFSENLLPHPAIPLFGSACPKDSLRSGQTTTGLVPTNTAFVPCKTTATATDKMQGDFSQPTTLAAGPEYTAGWWKRLWFGSHYRTTWAQPVTVPYLDLDTTFGGLAIYKKGGGRQTTSLKFRAGDGSVLTFRSVNKDPAKALNYKLVNTVAKSVIRDQTSTQHPYGALVAAPLMDKIGLLHASPRLFRLPDDPKLGPFQKKYGGLFGMLEESPGKPDKAGRLFGGADRIDQSVSLFKRMYRDHDTEINAEEFARARLFDILVGDWSKHEDNWKWAGQKIPSGYRYRPIPRDRDHVFSMQDGIINWLADRPFGVQNLEHFGFKPPHVRSLTFQARHMDRFLLPEVDYLGFMKQAKYIQDHISDADIEFAVRQMPPEAWLLSGEKIEGKLKARLQYLPKMAEEYYGLLAKEVDVTGSKDDEYFEVEYVPDGSVRVQVFDKNKDGSRGEKMLFSRTFHTEHTDEVRLWGLAGDDVFHTSLSGPGRIKVRAFGGPGDDVFIDNAGNARTLFYDKGKETAYEMNGKAKVVNHWNTELYEYDRTRFEYNYSLPIVYVAYSGVTGFGLNFGRNFTIRRFGKDEYHSKHAVGFGITTEGNKKAFYSGRFHQAFRRWDLLVDASLDDPMVRNRFFGLGNDTENNTDELGKKYYRSEISTLLFSLGTVRDFWQKSSFQFKFGVEKDESNRVANTFLSDNEAQFYGAHQRLTMLPAELALDLDFRDEKGLPYRGARLGGRYQFYSVLSDVAASSNFGVASGEMEVYFSSKRRRPVTLGLRFGGATTHGDVPWYKLPTLGSANGLRGYVEDRFAGGSALFFNSEVRYQFLERQTQVLPIKAGMKVFYDAGIIDPTSGSDWRSGYGFGFYLVPLDEAVTIALTFGFSEEQSVYPIFSIGKALR